jgi:Bacterial Ig-like domain (group 3)
MNRRTSAALMGGLVLAVMALTGLAGPAWAATRPAVASAAKVSTTTSMTATESAGTTGPKITFAIRVKAASGAIPQGTVSLSVDHGTPVTLTLKPTGRISLTHHYKVGAHTATATYSGSATDTTSTVTVAFAVT